MLALNWLVIFKTLGIGKENERFGWLKHDKNFQQVYSLLLWPPLHVFRGGFQPLENVF